MLILQSVCSDYVLAKVLGIVKTGLILIQLIVPILLIVSGWIKFTKMVINPDEKKTMKVFINSVFAAAIVFFLPVVINLTMTIISVNGDVGINENGNLQTFDLSSCWVSAEQIEDQMDSANDNTTRTIKQEEQ